MIAQSHAKWIKAGNDLTQANPNDLTQFQWQDEYRSLSAKELNTRGFRAYKNDCYADALKFFLEAVQKDPTYAQAHFNAACAATLLLDECGNIKEDPTGKLFKGEKPDIFGHLGSAIHLDKKFIQKVRTDLDLEKLRDQFDYFKVLGYVVSNDSNFKEMLRATTWRSIPGPGAQGTFGVLKFSSETEFQFTWREIQNGPVNNFEGNYRVHGGKINFEFSQPVKEASSYVGTVTDQGALDFSPPITYMSGNGWGYCDAD